MWPAVLVVLPLAGLALQSADRLSIYLNAGATGANPLEAARRAWRLTGNYLDEGSFAPVGRFVEFVVHGLAIEAGDALSLTPHAALGAVRVAMVGLVAVLTLRAVESLQRSAHAPAGRSFIGLYPLAFAAVLVANGLGGGLVQAPHRSVGAVAVVLATALATGRDRDMTARRVAWHEYVSMAALGAAAAAFDELAYLAPFVAAAFLAARTVASGVQPRAALRLAAVRRWVALWAGFAAVFVPARIAVAQRCAAGYSCDDGWILDFGFDAIQAAVARVGSALPLAGWIANSDRTDAAGLDLGFTEVLANSMLVVALAVLAALTIAAVLREGRAAFLGEASRDEAPPGEAVPGEAPPGEASPGEASSADSAADPARSQLAAGQLEPSQLAHGRLARSRLEPRQPGLRQLRPAGALGGFGAAMAGAAALYAGLSWEVQQLPFGHAVRQGWRDTLLAQVGWSLIAAAVLACLDLVVRRRAAQALKPLAALALAAAAGFTLVANWQLAQIDRYDSTASITTLISASTVNLGTSDRGPRIAEVDDWPVRTDGVDYPAPPNAVRCLLLQAYADAASRTGANADADTDADADRDTSGVQGHIVAEELRADLNRLTAQRNGVPYCDTPAVAAADTEADPTVNPAADTTGDEAEASAS